jgi:CheY-like chemotaxis protein
MVKTSPPDVIVLDVMLPDVDGWKLLMELHEDPVTRPIPIVVCSVIREEELAYSLGAAAYLSKPVDPRAFIQVLEQASARAPGGAARAPASSEAV